MCCLSRGIHQQIQALRREEIHHDKRHRTAHAIDHGVENGLECPETRYAQTVAQRRHKQAERRKRHHAGRETAVGYCACGAQQYGMWGEKHEQHDSHHHKQHGNGDAERDALDVGRGSRDSRTTRFRRKEKACICKQGLSPSAAHRHAVCQTEKQKPHHHVGGKHICTAAHYPSHSARREQRHYVAAPQHTSQPREEDDGKRQDGTRQCDDCHGFMQEAGYGSGGGHGEKENGVRATPRRARGCRCL